MGCRARASLNSGDSLTLSRQPKTIAGRHVRDRSSSAGGGVKAYAFTFRYRRAISSIRDRHARVHGRLWASNPLRDSSEQIRRGAVASHDAASSRSPSTIVTLPLRTNSDGKTSGHNLVAPFYTRRSASSASRISASHNPPRDSGSVGRGLRATGRDARRVAIRPDGRRACERRPWTFAARRS
jgi:hypothetical protein